MYPDPSAVVRQAIAGDSEALDALWRQHRGWLAAVLLAHLPPQGELDDLLQDVAVAVVRQIRSLRDPQAIRPWLRRIALNTAFGALRRTSAAGNNGMLRRPGTSDGPPRSRADGTVPAHLEKLDARTAIGRMLDLVESLPVKYREPLLLRAVRGLSQHQIAETLRLGVKTVETRLLRARRMLRASCQTDPQCSADTARPSCPGRLND